MRLKRLTECAPRGLSLAVLAVLLVTGVTLAPAAAAQSSGDGLLTEAFGIQDEDADGFTADDGLAAGWSAFQGGLERLPWWVSSKTGLVEPQQPAAAEAVDATRVYNANNQTLLSYVNNRSSLSDQTYVEHVTWHIQGERASRYAVTNISNGSIQSTTMVSDTSKTVDGESHLCGFAAEQSAEELEWFIDNYASQDKDVPQKELARLKGKYGEDVSTSVFPSSGECPEGS